MFFQHESGCAAAGLRPTDSRGRLSPHNQNNFKKNNFKIDFVWINDL
jgi:hypothetical protein